MARLFTVPDHLDTCMTRHGFLADLNGNSSSKRLFGLVSLLVLSASMFIGLWTGRNPDPTIVLTLGGVVYVAIAGSAAEFFAATRKP